jgi:hypothetical protein
LIDRLYLVAQTGSLEGDDSAGRTL